MYEILFMLGLSLLAPLSLVSAETCSNIKCSNIIDYVCGVAERGNVKVIRTFHNICHMNRIKCKLKSVAHIRQVPDSFCNIKRRHTTTGRRLADFSIVGAHQACNHTCPTYCVDTYEPACALIWTSPDSFKYRPMINHCHIDLLSCAAGVKHNSVERIDNEPTQLIEGISDFTEILPSHVDETSQPTPSHSMENNDSDTVPQLDLELLSALGDTGEDAPVYGENIHPDLAQRWLPILRKGLTKEVREKLLKENVIPENCKQLRAPTLKARDKKIEIGQHQLGAGITAVSKALSLLLTNDDKQTKIQAIKILSDACRILTDLHSSETQSRIKAITPLLDKSFLSVIQDVERDEFLFGDKLAEKIKASKAIEKQGLQIKKTGPVQKGPIPSTSQAQPITRSRFQGNWTGPPRFQSSSRGGRGMAQRTNQATRRTQPALNQPRSSNYKQHRALPRQ